MFGCKSTYLSLISAEIHHNLSVKLQPFVAWAVSIRIRSRIFFKSVAPWIGKYLFNFLENTSQIYYFLCNNISLLSVCYYFYFTIFSGWLSGKIKPGSQKAVPGSRMEWAKGRAQHSHPDFDWFKDNKQVWKILETMEQLAKKQGMQNVSWCSCLKKTINMIESLIYPLSFHVNSCHFRKTHLKIPIYFYSNRTGL